MEPADRRRGFRRILAAGVLGICLGALAFTGDDLRGVVAASFLGVVSSASTWMLATTLCGYRAGSGRIAAGAGALFGVGAATAYYLLRWITLQPWTMGGMGELSWSTSGASKFILVAAGWIIAMACGGAVLSAVTSRIPPQPAERTRVWLAIWLALCAAPALVSLSEWIPAAVTSWSTTDWSATADTGAVFAVVGALSALVVVLLVLGWWVRRTAGVTSPGTFFLIAAIATAVFVFPFHLGTDVYFALVHAI